MLPLAAGAGKRDDAYSYTVLRIELVIYSELYFISSYVLQIILWISGAIFKLFKGKEKLEGGDVGLSLAL